MKGQGRSSEGHPVKIAEVLEVLKGRNIPLISEDSTVEDAIETMVRFPHSRLLYVVDTDGRLKGTISLGNLVRHFFYRSHEPQIHPRFLLSMITTETAKDIMERHPIFATEEQDVERVLKRMVEKNVKEIAVLDSEKKLVGDMTMIDLLKFQLDRRAKKP